MLRFVAMIRAAFDGAVLPLKSTSGFSCLFECSVSRIPQSASAAFDILPKRIASHLQAYAIVYHTSCPAERLF